MNNHIDCDFDFDLDSVYAEAAGSRLCIMSKGYPPLLMKRGGKYFQYVRTLPCAVLDIPWIRGCSRLLTTREQNTMTKHIDFDFGLESIDAEAATRRLCIMSKGG